VGCNSGIAARATEWDAEVVLIATQAISRTFGALLTKQRYGETERCPECDSYDNPRPLQQDMAQHFLGQLVSIETLERYVLIDTPYALKHLKRTTLKPMRADGMITSPNQKKGAFPPGTLIQFAN
jgi:hypothetical protein